MDPIHIIGVGLALAAALAFASEGLLIRKGTEHGTVKDAVFITIGINLLVLIPIVMVLYYPNFGLTRSSWISFIAAGMFGTFLGRIFKFTSIEKIGASRTEPVVATWVLVAIVLGILFLDESLTILHGIGIALIVIGVVLTAWETSHGNPDNLSRRELFIGLLIPLFAAFAIGFEPIFASIGFAEGTPAPVGLLVKTAAAMVGLTLYLRWSGGLPTRALFGTNLRWYLLAGCASTIGLLSYYLGLELAPVNIVVPIISTSTLLVVVLAVLIMPKRLERVTWKLVAAATIVVLGVILVTLFGGTMG